MMMCCLRSILVGMMVLSAPASGSSVFVISTFDAGSDGWQPWDTSSAGGLSPGNPYLSVDADGSGVKGKAITFNPTAEWTGNYLAAGITEVRLDIANMSEFDTVQLRVAVGNRASPMQSGGTWWVSLLPVTIPTSSGWSQASLSLKEADLVRVGNEMGELGTDTYAETFSDIRNIRILSANLPLGAIGDEFIGTVAMDNISLIVPEPSTPLMFGLCVGLGLLRRRFTR